MPAHPSTSSPPTCSRPSSVCADAYGPSAAGGSSICTDSSMADTGLDSQSRDRAYRCNRPVLGDYARTIDQFGETFSGERMADHDGLAERLADTGSRWGCSDPRINGTLWWYSASSTMVAASVTMLCAEGIAPEPQ